METCVHSWPNLASTGETADGSYCYLRPEGKGSDKDRDANSAARSVRANCDHYFRITTP
jgi:hypothetical protein